jgi:PEP-CTERM motif
MKTQTFGKNKWYLRFAFTLAGVLASSTSALAVTFNFSYQPGTTQEQIQAVELAGNIWSSYLQDTNVVLNIHLAMTNSVLPNNKLGGAIPALKKINYDKFKLGLAADGTANINLLPTSSQASNKYVVKLQNGSINSNFYELIQTTANNKALGNDISGNASGLDGYIQLEQSANWSYNYAGGTIGQNQYDFVSVVLHELGHNLGFISGVDLLSNLALPSALDIFRYSTQSASQGAIDLGVGSNSYFSMNGGATNLGNFATGVNTSLGGDGYQASHWKINNNNSLGIMSPLLVAGQIKSISTLDLQAMDVIGWNVNHSAQLNMNTLLQNAQTKASNALIANRTSDVEEMMETSGIYDMGGSSWCNSIINPGCSWWQQGDTNTVANVPEPSATMGLLGFFGIAALWKRQGQKKGVAKSGNDLG